MYNNNFILEKSEVMDIIHDFLLVNLGDLRANQSNKSVQLDYSIDLNISTLELDETLSESMTMHEMLCLIDDVKDNWNYDFKRSDNTTIHSSDIYYMETCRMKHAIMDASRGMIPIRLFLNLRLKSFYEALAEDYLLKHEDAEAMKQECWSVFRFYKQMGGKTAFVDLTIDEYLKYLGCKLGEGWQPQSMTLVNYGKKIISLYEGIARVLINSFKMVYPESFNVKQLIEKYSDSEYEDGEL